MTAQELKQQYDGLYQLMAASNKPSHMKAFGAVMNEMVDWLLANKPELAKDYIEKLESIKWKNYLTTKEAEAILAGMEPKAPWTKDQWRTAMEQHGYALEEEPCYNSCAMFVTMSMIHSDSKETLARFIADGDVFEVIHALALDKLKDKDGVFNIRRYFKL